uniref:U6 snRNA (guanine-N(2))-methyltransferase THUMPD2 n=1 Tax=Rhinopithecus bieti TaxID=61621 RepID=A0A2K6LEW7_RHIBE
MSETRGEPGSGTEAGARFFCTAGRGLEPFLMREVRARLAATEVEYISGKVFFTTCSDLNMLKKLKSQFPLISSVSKGKLFNEMQRLINEDPGSWLNAISIWKNLLELDIEENRDCQLEKQIEEETLEQRDVTTKSENFQEEFQNDIEKAIDTHNQKDLTFRVSCRCSGTIRKAFTAQEVGKVIGIAIMKHFGWKADLRNPKLEIFIHLNDVYSVVGIPVFRVPLASRAYIKTAGLRSTIAWAMASLADIKAGAFVLDPMCGLGTILLEAAKEWPDVYYVGADVSDSQLLGTWDNLKAAGLEDKIELLKLSVIELPLPSESVDIIISDIPFGKKFKLGKDIKSILQEMERVLHVGGTIVLLLSEDHHRRLTDCKESSIPFNSKDSHTDEPGIKKCLNPEEKTGASKTVSTSFEARNHEFLDRMSPFGSLLPVECYKVSLGKTDAFICKYKKSHSSGL